MTNGGGHPKPKKPARKKVPAKPKAGAKAWAAQAAQGKPAGK